MTPAAPFAAHAINLEWNGRHYHFCGLPCVARFAAAPGTFLARAISDPTPLSEGTPPRLPDRSSAFEVGAI